MSITPPPEDIDEPKYGLHRRDDELLKSFTKEGKVLRVIIDEKTPSKTRGKSRSNTVDLMPEVSVQKARNSLSELLQDPRESSILHRELEEEYHNGHDANWIRSRQRSLLKETEFENIKELEKKEWKCVQIKGTAKKDLKVIHIVIDKIGLFDRDTGSTIVKFKYIKELCIGRLTENVVKGSWTQSKKEEMFFSILQSKGKLSREKYYDFCCKNRKRRKEITYEILDGMSNIGLVPTRRGLYRTKKAIQRIRKDTQVQTLRITFEPGESDEPKERKKYVEAQRSKYLAKRLLITMGDMEKQRTEYENQIREIKRQSTMGGTTSTRYVSEVTTNQTTRRTSAAMTVASEQKALSKADDKVDTGILSDTERMSMENKQELVEMRKSLAEAKEMNLTMEEALKEANGQNRVLQDRIDSLSTELNAIESTRNSESTRNNNDDEALKEMNARFAELNVVHENMKTEMANRDVANDVAFRALEKIKKENAILIKAKEEQEKRYAEMQVSCRRVRSDFQRTRKGVVSFKKESHDHIVGINNVFVELKPLLKKALTNHALEEMKERYQKEWKLRRKYFNIVQDLRGNIRVFCRFRPLLPFELEKGFTECVEFRQDGEVNIVNEKGKTFKFEFDKVYNPETTQEDVTKDTSEYIQSVMDGYNVSIFAYGQTGSGKTYTMNGPKDNPGVNLRALKHLFKIKEERDQFKYKIEVSILEIYMEKIADLIEDGEEVIASETGQLTVKNTHLTATPNLSRASSFGGSNRSSPRDSKASSVTPRASNSREFRISHSKDGSVDVAGLTKVEVNSEDDIQKLNDLALRNRSSRATDMNEHSSRSHMLLCVYVTGKNTIDGVNFNSKLWLVDLAGSERVKKSGATGQSMKEAQNINKSLSALGDVIAALQKKAKFIPYRNSKLTDLMASALGGKAKTIMFINCCPATEHAFETTNSLRFAERVGKVELGKAEKKVARRRKTAKTP